MYLLKTDIGSSSYKRFSTQARANTQLDASKQLILLDIFYSTNPILRHHLRVLIVRRYVQLFSIKQGSDGLRV